MKLYTLRLSATEARLCRDAAKEFHDDPQRSSEDVTDYYIQHGEQQIRRDFLVDFERWLRWYATDMEVKQTLADRKAAEAASRRLEFLLEVGSGVEVDVPEQVPAGRLF